MGSLIYRKATQNVVSKPLIRFRHFPPISAKVVVNIDIDVEAVRYRIRC